MSEKFLNKHHEQLHNKISEELKTNSRKCAKCGVVETMDNLMLKYDNGEIMCDECAFDYYSAQEKGGVK